MWFHLSWTEVIDNVTTSVCCEQLSLKTQPVLSIMYTNLWTCLILVFVHDGQNKVRFQRQLFTADRSRYVVNDFCSRKMKSYKSVNLISIKVLDTQIYLKTTNRGFLN